MTARPSLRQAFKSTSIYAVGLLAQRMLSVLLLPLYTRYIPPADYAVLDVLDTTIAVFGVVFGARFSSALLYFYAKSDTAEEKGETINTALIGATVFGVLAGLLGILAAPYLSLATFGTVEYARPLQIMLATFAMNVPSEVGWGWLRSENRAVLFVISSIIQMVLGVALNVLFLVYYDMGYKSVLWTALIAAVLLTFTFLISARRLRPGGLGLPLLWKMVKFSAPLGLVSIAGFIFHSGDRFILVRYVPLTAMGEYALAYKIGMVASLAGTAFSQYWSAKQFSHMEGDDGPRELARVFTYVAFVVTYLAFCIWAFALPTVTLLTDAAYHGAAKYVPWLLLPYWIRVLADLLRSVFYQHRRTIYDAFVNLIAAVLCIAAYALLIPAYGIWGAVISTNIAFASLCAASWIFARRLMPIPLEWGRLARLILVTVVLGAVIPFEGLFGRLGQIALASCLALLFPILLRASGFLNSDELGQVRTLWQSVADRLRSAVA